MTPPIDFIILRPADVPLMREMLGTFARAFGDPETYLGNQATDAYLSDLLGKAHFIAICAKTGPAVAGGLVAYQLDKFEQDRREIYIYDLAVDAEFRRRGIATAMINLLQDEALRRDAYVIFVQADLVDAPAIALYEKLGIKETAHHFDIAPARKTAPA
ncbi:MAG TPA: GNAT family N-acetyltransferase [Hyphomicrobium zavarzinii]|jgi:aminoglycoside 3-N-acetyltransferase I|nr:GNAT family N-acetyltransferase [Hyphomicrobium zavarzinii]